VRPEAPSSPTGEIDVFVARQPIFDAAREVHGYELLFRDGPDNFYAATDHDEASCRVISDSLLVHGFDTLLDGKKAFINVTRRVLVDQLFTVLPARRAVAEIPADLVIDAEVVDACKALRAAGFAIALDGYQPRPELIPLLPLADYIKIDVAAAGHAASLAALASLPARRIAEKVETHEAFAAARAAGFTLFQGYFFCRPEVLAAKDVRGFRVHHLRFLREINQPEIRFDRLEEIIKADVSISLRLLRYLNSAAFSWRTKVTSIKQALVALGELHFRKWAALVAIAGLGEGRPSELVRASLVRARFCELLAGELRQPARPIDLFFTGLLSLVDALAGRPLAQVIAEVALSPAVAQALLGDGSVLGQALAMAKAYEHASWPEVRRIADELKIDPHHLPAQYHDALAWADRATKGAA
jgi:c-di-GMP-related signal transduction protein